MKTKIYKITLENDPQLLEAAKVLKNGGLVAIPTETVYGLAANALSGKAVKSIFAAKGRPADNPLIIHISHLEQLIPLIKDFPEKSKKLAKAFWPGPLTMVFDASPLIPGEVSAGLSTVAVRMPANPVARKIIELTFPLAAPSANSSGTPSPTSAAHVLSDLGGRIDAVIDGGECKVGIESTVISMTGRDNPPVLLRPGGISVEDIEQVIGEIKIDPAVYGRHQNNKPAASPGMNHRHYSPGVKVVVLKGPREKYIDYVNNRTPTRTGALCFEEDVKALNVKCVSFGKENDADSQATAIFKALRELDKLGVETVYARCPEPVGVGLAVYNRLLRAADFNVINL